ncbi:endo alpha-1,4 polygalactosaminidase [Streptomyces sp. NPDC051217]|uniref:endo alpha-1,4 polygalactosaminidase n=1 Tax=Streptomyces sp. NPDC051217 TaxID=3365644 RepID=UPI0037B28658
MTGPDVHTLKARSIHAVAALTIALITPLLVSSSAASRTAAAPLPPVHAGFDYQIGGAYPPPAGVSVVSRDREDSPARGIYNICYVNAFQVQPDELDAWEPDLLLRDDNGDVIIDEEWDEAILDVGTAGKRDRIAARVNGWIDGCADNGFQAVEPDNYDSYERSRGRFGSSAAMAYITLLSEHAHEKGLAIGQKNTAGLARFRDDTGLDFAVVEECGEYEECDSFTEYFDDNVIVIEYTSRGLATACAGWQDSLSIVRRDLDVAPAGGDGYLRRTC